MDTLEGLLKEHFDQSQRPNDGLLHCSTDLLGPLRHTQLRLSEAPSQGHDFYSNIRLETGNLWHSTFERLFKGQLAITEFRLDEYLPEGWSGRADWLMWNKETKKFRLGDLKTTASTYYVHKEGVKDEHLWQGSAYYRALKVAGVPLDPTFDVFYLPMSGKALSLLSECKPLGKAQVWAKMQKRWDTCQRFLEGKEKLAEPDYKHWIRKYCPYPNSLCDCNKED